MNTVWASQLKYRKMDIVQTQKGLCITVIMVKFTTLVMCTDIQVSQRACSSLHIQFKQA